MTWNASRLRGLLSRHRIARRRVLVGALALAGGKLAGPAPAITEAAMNHVVLLGDSVFDNSAYVRGGPDVVRQMRERLPGGWQATLAAVDGNVMGDIPRQIARIPADASHLVVSIGGNDALRHVGIFTAAAGSMTEALARLAGIRERFQLDYRATLDALLARRLPTAVCTIYEARFPDPDLRRVAATALTLLNDAITREAFARGVPLIDLRLVCDDDADFANPIEPSVRGGEKITAAIAKLLAEHDFGRGRSAVFAR